MKSGQLVVKHHSPLQKHTMMVVGAVLLVGIGWGLYIWGKKTAGFDQIETSEREQNYESSIEGLKRERIALRDQIALLERSNQMDKQAYGEVDTNLKSLQEEILELREEVSFYRGIVSPRESSAGLRVERIKVEKSNQDNLFRYEMVLTQVLKNHRNIRGVAKFVVEGLQDGRARELPLGAIAVSGKKSLDFKFRYFQKFEGDFLLPTEFVPRSIHISVKSAGKKEIESSFEWASLVGDGGEIVATQSSEQSQMVVVP